MNQTCLDSWTTLKPYLQVLYRQFAYLVDNCRVDPQCDIHILSPRIRNLVRHVVFSKTMTASRTMLESWISEDEMHSLRTITFDVTSSWFSNTAQIESNIFRVVLERKSLTKIVLVQSQKNGVLLHLTPERLVPKEYVVVHLSFSLF